MGCYLRAAPNTGSVVVRDSIVQVMTLGSLKSLEGRNLVNICPNGISEESISIYSKNRCQWSDRLIKTKFKLERYGRLKLQRP